VVCGSAKGDTIISTFGPDNSSGGSGTGNGGPSELAFPFIVPVGPDYIFTSAALALMFESGTNAIDISIATDSSDKPGTVLETIHLENALEEAGTNNPLLVANSVVQPLLLAGSQYWLIESPSELATVVFWDSAGVAPNPPQS